jgi:hypothetical protein
MPALPEQYGSGLPAFHTISSRAYRPDTRSQFEIMQFATYKPHPTLSRVRSLIPMRVYVQDEPEKGSLSISTELSITQRKPTQSYWVLL